MHPLRRLFQHAEQYRRQVLLASLFSVLNKLFDVLPEVLIGVAVDVVVSRKASFLARFGVSEPHQQLITLAIITVFVWVFESTFEYLYAIRWRNLAQNLQHDLRMQSYAHVAKAGFVVVRAHAHGHVDERVERRHQPDGALSEWRRQ